MLDVFLKMPRLAQLMVFDKVNGKRPDRACLMFYAIGFETDECKSPIEQILKLALDIRVFERDLFRGAVDIYFSPQKQITVNGKKYYADFYFDAENEFNSEEINKNYKLVIECDGHDYHHASKAQVRKDYERENDLKMAGYDVMRFTGSQIYDDPYGCADKIIDYILKHVLPGAGQNG